jgi:hypothetical protein
MSAQEHENDNGHVLYLKGSPGVLQASEWLAFAHAACR